MRLHPLLLHALLSLALVANGMSGAMASVHAACEHDAVAAAAPAVEVSVVEVSVVEVSVVEVSAAQAPAAQAPAAEVPCHEDMGTETSSAASGMDHQDKSQQAATSDGEGCGDCAEHCQCACIAHGFTALMPPTLLLHAATGIAYLSAPSYTHTAPALPHPVRPPIG